MSIRVAVLGCGSIGRRHARNLRTLGYRDLVLFDPDPKAGRRAAEEAGGIAIDDLAKVWRLAPEIVIVAAPSALHLRMAVDAARRDCHLLIEKPLSHTEDDLHLLEAEIEERDLITLVACNMRFHPGPKAVKRIIEAGRVGRILAARLHAGSYLPRWRPGTDYRKSYSASPESGGAILDLIHEVDLALWYLGPASVQAALVLNADSLGLETDGLAEILLRHDSGAISSVHVNFVQRDYRRTCQVIGTEGTIGWDFSDARVTVYGPDGELVECLDQPLRWDVNQMYVDELDHFMSCAREGRSTVNPVSSARTVLRVALEARSLRKRNPS